MQRVSDINSSSKLSAHSLKIANQFKGKQYAKIFEQLDSDGDGVISGHAIDLDTVDSKVLEALTCVFSVIDEGAELNVYSFAALIEENWGKLSHDQKGSLMKRESKADGPQEPPVFVSSNSAKILESNGRNKEGLFNRLNEGHRLNLLRRETEKKIKEQEKLKQCTFKPSINKKK